MRKERRDDGYPEIFLVDYAPVLLPLKPITPAEKVRIDGVMDRLKKIMEENPVKILMCDSFSN